MTWFHIFDLNKRFLSHKCSIFEQLNSKKDELDATTSSESPILEKHYSTVPSNIHTARKSLPAIFIHDFKDNHVTFAKDTLAKSDIHKPKVQPAPTPQKNKGLPQFSIMAIPTFLQQSGYSKKNLDTLLSLIGSFGMYQKFEFFLIALLAILPSIVAYSYVFVSATPNFTCKTVREENRISLQIQTVILNLFLTLLSCTTFEMN